MVLPITPKNSLVYLPKIIISNIIKLRLIYETNTGKKRKNTKHVVCVFFFRQGKKTVKCASGEVGRSSYVSAQKKNYTPMPKCSVRKF